MSDCLFCKIIKGDIPSLKVYEDDLVYAFLDIAPVNPGHTLIVPKEHFDDVEQMSEEQAAAAFARVHRLAPKIRAAVGALAWNLGLNTGKAAGQVVMHAHWHVMPRFVEDGLTHWPKKHFTDAEMKSFAADIVAALSQ